MKEMVCLFTAVSTNKRTKANTLSLIIQVTTESHLLVPSRTYRAGRGSALEFHYDFAKGMSRVSFEFRMGSVDAGSIEVCVGLLGSLRHGLVI